MYFLLCFFLRQTVNECNVSLHTQNSCIVIFKCVVYCCLTRCLALTMDPYLPYCCDTFYYSHNESQHHCEPYTNIVYFREMTKWITLPYSYQDKSDLFPLCFPSKPLGQQILDTVHIRHWSVCALLRPQLSYCAIELALLHHVKTQRQHLCNNKASFHPSAPLFTVFYFASSNKNLPQNVDEKYKEKHCWWLKHCHHGKIEPPTSKSCMYNVMQKKSCWNGCLPEQWHDVVNGWIFLCSSLSVYDNK